MNDSNDSAGLSKENQLMTQKPDLTEALLSRLRLIEDIRTKLVHVKWSRESFVLLARVAQDAIQAAKDDTNAATIADLVTQIEHQVNDCLHGDRLPQGAEREQLMAMLNTLQRTWHHFEETDQTTSALTALHKGEIMLIANDTQQLLSKLKQAGFQVQNLTDLDKARNQLIKTSPTAIIVDADVGDTPLAGIDLIAKVRARIGISAPVFFLGERSDLAARLEAVWSGSAGYFTKPVNVTALLDKIHNRLFQSSSLSYRVLIVDDKPKQAGAIARTLEAKGIITQVITQPRSIIQAIHRFRPNLLILDLDLSEISGIDLAKVIGQHEACDDLPMLLLSSESKLNHNLAALGTASGDILSKPLDDNYLLAAVMYRLGRAHTLDHKLSNLNNKDPVSGLYNRRFLLDQLERSFAAPKDDDRSIAIILIALNNITAVETTDLAVADELVEWTARRLQRLLTPDQLAARLGDAVFAVLLHVKDRNELLDIARGLRTGLESDIYEAGNDTVQLYTSIGASMADAQSEDFLALIQQADLAISIARKTAGDSVHVYHSQADQRVGESHERRLLKDIKDAVEQQHMNLVFQPVVNLRGDQTERYEVLLRMRNREGRELLPETVFGVAQRYRLGAVLDRWVIVHAIKLLRGRQHQGQLPILFINISPAILQDNSVAEWLTDGFGKTSVPPEYLVFEVSETTAAQYLEPLRKFLKTTKSLGCGFSLDRFGHQEKSLELAKSLPLDYVKLDPRHAHDLTNNLQKQQQLRSLAQALNELNITAIMHGIEDLPTLYALWSCGINYVQGYFLQRPHNEMSYDFEGGVV